MHLDEIAVLVLKDIVYRHPEFRSLEEFLTEKYGFRKMEEKEYKVSELKKLLPAKNGKASSGGDTCAPSVSEEIERKLSSLKIYEGNYMDARISVYTLGDVVLKEDIVAGTEEGEQYSVNTAEYQMIKLISSSGYAIQQLLERLTIDLGLGIRSKEWFFHRGREG